MGFLDKLRALPEYQKKVILWTIVVIFALIVFILWIDKKIKDIKSFNVKEAIRRLDLPKMPEVEIPEIEFPEILGEEEIKLLEEELKKEEELNKEVDKNNNAKQE